MVLLNTYFNVDELLTKEAFFKLVLDRLRDQFKSEESEYTGKDENLVKSSVFDFYDDFSTCPSEYMCRLKHDDHVKSIYIGNYENNFLYSQKTDNKDASSFVTYYVLDNVNHILSVKKECLLDAASLSSDVVLSVPEVLKLLFWNEYVAIDKSSNDNALLWDNKPVFVRKADIDFAKGVLNGTEVFNHPIVYVSPTKNGVYDVDCDELARGLMGQAHVLVEASPLVTTLIQKDLEKDKYPFDDNDNDHSRTALYCSGNRIALDAVYSNTTQVIHEVQNIVSDISLPATYDFTRIRESYAFNKLGAGDSELSGLFESILHEKDIEIQQLKDSLDKLKQQTYYASVKADAIQDNFDKQQTLSDNVFTFDSTEKDLYTDERKDVVLKVLQKEYDTMKDDINLSHSRKADVLKDVLEHNFPSGTDTEYTELLKSAFNDGSLTREGIGHLQSVGFVITKEARNSHWQFKFGDDRYMATFASTPSDKARGVKNFVSNYSNILFGY